MFDTTQQSEMKVRVVLMSIALFFAGCAELSHADNQNTRVSLVELIGTGTHFEGWRIGTIGYVRSDSGFLLLFLDENRARLGDSASAVSMSADGLSGIDEVTDGYYLVEGTYSSYEREQYVKGELQVGSPSAGEIFNITRILLLENSE